MQTSEKREKSFFQEYYSSKPICFSLQIGGRKEEGWLYSFLVYGCFVMLCCLIITFLYIEIYKQVLRSSKNFSTSKLGERSKKLKLNSLLIVGTNLLCWCPISFLGQIFSHFFIRLYTFLYLFLQIGIYSIFFDLAVTKKAYTAILIIILPINSIINPILYTTKEITKHWKLSKQMKVIKLYVFPCLQNIFWS